MDTVGRTKTKLKRTRSAAAANRQSRSIESWSRAGRRSFAPD